VKEFVIRNVTTFWFDVSALYLIWMYSLLALLNAGMDLCPPAAWPPLFRNIGDAYTLRGFWGYVSPSSFHDFGSTFGFGGGSMKKSWLTGDD
jgi:hypothetical protein